MKNIKVLDVTLRDGGCVNDFNFGSDYMNLILSALERSGVDFIELGYLDDKKGSEFGRTQYKNEQVIKNFLKCKLPNIEYVAMMDYGKFDVSKLAPRTENDIDGIRVAFHKKNWRDIVNIGKHIMAKGYKFYIQPMITLRYSDSELLDLIKCVNEELSQASGFYIVDSFGEMRNNDVVRILHLIDHNLISSMPVGFHSHNNLQLSYSNAMTMLSFSTNRNLMLDSSIMGMGKGAGNLNTELLLEHLNLFYDKHYALAPLMEVIDQVIEVIHKEMYWGYSVEYYLSSINHCTPTYASHFYNKHMLSIDQLSELLSMIPEDKRISFDKDFAERLYYQYNTMKGINDSETITQIINAVSGKKVLLIAPGKSINKYESKILEKIHEDGIISISLNNFKFATDFIMATREEIIKKCIDKRTSAIVTSNANVMSNTINNFYIL